ncbi:MAG: hybrid sensor histidine kinase/response regulator [Flavobacteriaceae bacterium]|nr:hybrid sensor histidine kinase/response regulator [Flavobacteriaceae bacterium]
MASSLFGQDTKTDTLQLIEKYRDEAIQALQVQDFETAILSLNDAGKLANEASTLFLKGDIRYHIAELHYLLQNYAKASKEINQSIAFIEPLDKQKELSRAITLKALIFIQLGRLAEADEALKKADLYFTETNDEKNRADVLLGLGLLEAARNNFNSAVNYFEAAIPVFQAYGKNYHLAQAYFYKADALLHLNTQNGGEVLTSAKIAAQKAKEISAKNSFTKINIDSYRLLYHIALRERQFALAESYIETYERRDDSLQQVYLNAISKGVDAESNIVEMQKTIDTQQNDLDKKNKSIIFGQMTTGLSIALIVILSLLTLSLYKNNNLRAKANNLLQDKNVELELAKEKAEKASLAKAQFLSTITHELRTPLYAVTGLTHLLLEEDPKEHQKEHLNSLKFSGEYLLSLINNILDLNKLEANKVEMEKTTFNLKKRINDVLIALRKSADDRKNKLHLEYDESIPDKLVGDPLKLSQILINLIGNSVKFTQNGDVTVRIQKMEEKKNKVLLHFEIEDSGVGISKKKQKSIFETFSQGSLQINRKFGGTGLGLSIVKNLLELMNSKIHLESQLGKGSKFHFNIAFEISEELQEDKNPRNIIYDVDYIALEGKSILVVEDNKINQMITKKIVEKNKMKCMVADNGMEAIKIVKENNFDVILMDIHMPGISGIEATQKIREFDKNIPIIALTAVTIDENLDDFYRAGFNEIIPKPFKTEEFFEKIYRTMQHAKSALSH